MNLAEAKTGFSGPIKGIQGDPIITSRLFELGFSPGETVTLKGSAPFGEPLFVETLGATLALRKKEAQCIQI